MDTQEIIIACQWHRLFANHRFGANVYIFIANQQIPLILIARKFTHSHNLSRSHYRSNLY